MKYDVTIGIPVYKSEAYIRQTLDSLLAQTYPSIEFLFVDDCGGDSSLSIIQEIKESHPRGCDIHLITHQINEGVSVSRNQIIQEAQGGFLYFMDSDDVIKKDAISLMMSNVRLFDAEIVFGSYEKIEISGMRTVYQYPSLYLHGKDALACFAYRKYAGIQASSCNYLVKTAVLRNRNLRFIDTDYWEDFVFTFDLVTCISCAVLLPDITYTYQCHEGSLSHYQQRDVITKDEIMKNVRAVEHLKKTSSLLYNKVYYPNRCLNIVMTDFYIVCNVLKRRKAIIPYLSDSELKSIMTHPATFRHICAFRQSMMKNLFFYFLGKLPPFLCIKIIWSIGKVKKLI
jgi:glycosyltransferase involved in cell wall biosynthesis